MPSPTPVQSTLSLPHPHDHLLHVSMSFPQTEAYSQFEVKMPVWSPGSYLVREYARHVQGMRAFDQTGRPLPLVQTTKSSWRVSTDSNTSDVTVRYQVFAHELAVRTNHVDDTHASINGVATYLYHDDYMDRPVRLDFSAMPPSWSVWGGADEIDAERRMYQCGSFDLLYDTPLEIGEHEPLEFSVRGIPHRIVFWGGEPNVDMERLGRDVAKIVEAHAAMFGGLPYEHYTFIVHLNEKGRGGLEHHNSTLLLWARQGFRPGPPGTEVDAEGFPQENYLEFLRLVSHEFFHTWNVKRIRPERLGPFDYQQENYTRDLWTVEGITCYYELIGLFRAGLLDRGRVLEILAKDARQLSLIPGRQVLSLEAASLNAWVKLYRPDENTKNSSVSYYLKGELVSFLLDAMIRVETKGEHSLDDVLLALWTHYNETGKGYQEGSYIRWIKQVTGVDASGFARRFIGGTDDIEWSEELAKVGLTSRQDPPPQGAMLGISTVAREGRVMVTDVLTGSGAQAGGVYAGDELVALGGTQVVPGTLSALLAQHVPGTRVTVHLFRRGMLLEREVVLGAPPSKAWHFEVSDDALAQATELLDRWFPLSSNLEG